MNRRAFLLLLPTVGLAACKTPGVPNVDNWFTLAFTYNGSNRFADYANQERVAVSIGGNLNDVWEFINSLSNMIGVKIIGFRFKGNKQYYTMLSSGFRPRDLPDLNRDLAMAS